jgi:Na+/glutamate symporter
MSASDNENKAVSANKTSSPSDNDLASETRLIAPSSAKIYQHPSLQAIAFQFISLTIALILNILRKSQPPIAILGFKVGLVGGIVPAECLVFVLMIYELITREIWFEL